MQISEKTLAHKEVWKNKKILRIVYKGWYNEISQNYSKGLGPTIELGSGSGNFKESFPLTISSDIQIFPWINICLDAQLLPFKAGSIQNVVMVDLLHHVSNPIALFKEIARILKPGGRIIIVEPFPSPLSLVIYKRYHPEPFLMNVDYFSKNSFEKKEIWDSNQAMAFLLFFKFKKRFVLLFNNDFKMRLSKKMSCILYPLSGGFDNKALIPDWFIPILLILEILCKPLLWLLAFRCFIVIEKR